MPMVERHYVPPTGPGAANGATAVAPMPPGYRLALARETVTERRHVPAAGSSPVALFVQDDRRKGAAVYLPATDPHGTPATQATVWIGSDPGREETWFPLEPGATYTHESHGPLYAVSTTADTPRVYTIADRF